MDFSIARAQSTVITATEIPGARIDLDTLFGNAVGLFTILIAVGAFASLLYSGFAYITAGGDPGKAEIARKNIIWAIIGIVIALVSYALVTFVANWSGASLTANRAFAATSPAVIIKNNSGETISSLVIPGDAGASSWPVYVSLSAAPEKEVKLEVFKEGALNLNYTGSNNLVFTPTDYQTGKIFNISYPGNGKIDQQARFRLSAATVVGATLRVGLGKVIELTPTATATTQTGGTGNKTAAPGAIDNTQYTDGGFIPTSFSSLSILPPCLRSANEATKAGLGCVVESIRYYTTLLLLLVALGSFVYVLYGAFLYSTAFGDESKVAQAKKTISYALIGVVIATLAGVIVAFIRDFFNVA